ncbi:hypothetical protein [Flammeovirga aprica]|nr:hypothetical protein [Flammeovirga aprica]
MLNNYTDYYSFGIKIGHQADGKYHYGDQGEFAEDETEFYVHSTKEMRVIVTPLVRTV